MRAGVIVIKLILETQHYDTFVKREVCLPVVCFVLAIILGGYPQTF